MRLHYCLLQRWLNKKKFQFISWPKVLLPNTYIYYINAYVLIYLFISLDLLRKYASKILHGFVSFKMGFVVCFELIGFFFFYEVKLNH